MQIILIIVLIVALASIISYQNKPEVKGYKSEQKLASMLDNEGNWLYGGKSITNIYIPRADGTTSEIDVLYITKKGLFVFENKNYAGYIFGSEKNKNWTVSLYNGTDVEKYHFYNPIWQNKTHIKHLREYLNMNINIYSVISFSDRGDLKSVEVTSPNVFVCNHSKVQNVLNDVWRSSPTLLSDFDIERVYKRLLPLTNKTKEEKEKHIQNIREKQATINNSIICPYCGGKLVLRTAKRGENAGNQFYGCSNYPRCHFTKKYNNYI